MKTETLEEAAHEYFKRGQLGFEKAADTERAFLMGAKWQAERMYSEDEIYNMCIDAINFCTNGVCSDKQDFDEWFEQFKKK